MLSFFTANSVGLAMLVKNVFFLLGLWREPKKNDLNWKRAHPISAVQTVGPCGKEVRNPAFLLLSTAACACLDVVLHSVEQRLVDDRRWMTLTFSGRRPISASLD
jgi:hypothetical protein